MLALVAVDSWRPFGVRLIRSSRPTRLQTAATKRMRPACVIFVLNVGFIFAPSAAAAAATALCSHYVNKGRR